MLSPQLLCHFRSALAHFFTESLANIRSVRYPRASYPMKGISVNKAFSNTRLEAAEPAMMPAWSNGAVPIVALANDGSTLAVRCMR
jgi:hypothetical protein